MSPSSPKRFSQTYDQDQEDEGGSNRFTLTDYVYDREDEPAIRTHQSDQAANGGSWGYNATEERTEYIGYPDITLHPPEASQRDRPSSWGLALQSEIAQIRGSTIAYPPPTALRIMPDTASKEDSTPKRHSDSPDTLESSPRGRPDMSQFFRRRPPIDVSALPPPTHLSPGPAISPSSNEAIRRLPPIPTTTPPTSPPGSSGSTTSVKRLPTLPTTVSSSSIASSQPSPLLPPFQLASPKEFQPRPSLATMPSAGETEMEVLPSLPWAERERSISFVEEKESTTEKGGRTERGRSEPREKISRWWQWIIPESLFCKLLLGTVVVELMIDIIIEANILWRFNMEVRSSNSTQVMLENKRRLPIFLIIFGLAHLWQLILTIIAIRTKNTIQISAITIFNFAFLAWAVIQVSELRQILGDLQTSLIDDEPGSTTGTSGGQTSLLNLPLNVLTAVIIGVVATCCLVLSVLAYFVRREFGWQRYRFLGADLQIRGYYRRFQVLECLIYFSAFFTAGFGIQFIWLVLQRDDAEYIITWIMFPLSLILLVIGRTAAKYENKPFMIFFCCGLTLGEAYFIFKLIRIWQQSTTVYSNVSKSLTVFAVLSILSLMACLIGSILVYRDFGKGLKGAVLSQYPKSPRVGFNRWRTTDTTDDEELQTNQSSKSQKRISID